MQADHGVSLAAQEAKLRAYCTALDLELVSVEVDAGFSAASLNRPALTRALADLKARRADALLICKLDRLTRSLPDLAHLVSKYFSKRASLISVEESINTTTASGRLVLNLLTSVSSWEREAIGDRTRTAKAYQRTQGKYLGGGVPFGFRRAGEELVEDAGEQAVIVQVRALRAAGLSLRAIVATLAERGVALQVGLCQRVLARA